MPSWLIKTVYSGQIRDDSFWHLGNPLAGARLVADFRSHSVLSISVHDLSLSSELSSETCSLSPVLPEEPGRHGQADKDDEPAQHRLRYLAGQARRTVTADRASDHGQQAVAPNHLAVHHKND